MHLRGTSSWRVAEGENMALDAALFVRDRLGLDVPDVPVPRLQPRVEPQAGPPSARAASEWAAWWGSLTSEWVPAPGELASVRPRYESLKQTTLRFGVSFHDAMRWHEEHKRALIDRHLHTPPKDRLLITRTVHDVQESLGRTVAPFDLEIVHLPVEGEWFQRVRPTLLLVSEDLRHHLPAFRELLVPMVRELA